VLRRDVSALVQQIRSCCWNCARSRRSEWARALHHVSRQIINMHLVRTAVGGTFILKRVQKVGIARRERGERGEQQKSSERVQSPTLERVPIVARTATCFFIPLTSQFISALRSETNTDAGGALSLLQSTLSVCHVM
jgi:hypothetical protein